MSMQLAFYKGPANNIFHQVSHLGITYWTQSPYSHCEIVLDGVCYSSSSRDGGVRKTYINLLDGKWDVLDLPTSRSKEHEVRCLFIDTDACKYDWAGVGRYVFPSLPNSDNRWYCSEWCATALSLEFVDISPGQLYHDVRKLYNI